MPGYGDLVAYGANAAIPLIRSRKRRKIATDIYSNVMKNRQKYASAARKIQRAFRKAKKSRRARMQPSARASGKAVEQAKMVSSDNVRLRTLTGNYMPNPQPSSDAGDFNVRERSSCYYSGYKVCRVFENRGTAFEDVYTVNYCIVQMNRGFVGDVGAGGEKSEAEVLTDMRENFFRNNLETNTKVQDFQNAATVGTTLWDMTYDCRPMNPNKGYKIIFRKKFTLYPRAISGGERGVLRHNFKKFEFYMPIKKRMQFQTKNSSICNTPFFEVYWYNTRSPEDWPSSNPGSITDVKTYTHHKLYFRG